jgi:outer membrane protein assembly factor BamA
MKGRAFRSSALSLRAIRVTRDYVIRREFDLGEGDAYNRVLVDRAERRLNGLAISKRSRLQTSLAHHQTELSFLLK